MVEYPGYEFTRHGDILPGQEILIGAGLVTVREVLPHHADGRTGFLVGRGGRFEAVYSDELWLVKI